MPATPVQVVISDTSVLLNFMHIERLDLLENLPGYAFHVSEHVVAEVTRPDQAALLAASLEAGKIQLVTMQDATEISRYAELRHFLGDGEAATLAIAEKRGWMVACDEKKRFRREAEASIGAKRILNTVSLFVLAILKDRLTIAEADVLKDRLAKRRYRINIGSFAELMPRGR